MWAWWWSWIITYQIFLNYSIILKYAKTYHIMGSFELWSCKFQWVLWNYKNKVYYLNKFHFNDFIRWASWFSCSQKKFIHCSNQCSNYTGIPSKPAVLGMNLERCYFVFRNQTVFTLLNEESTRVWLRWLKDTVTKPELNKPILIIPDLEGHRRGFTET